MRNYPLPNNGSRERNAVKRPDQPAFDPVTALRSVPGFHWFSCVLPICFGTQIGNTVVSIGDRNFVQVSDTKHHFD